MYLSQLTESRGKSSECQPAYQAAETTEEEEEDAGAVEFLTGQVRFLKEWLDLFAETRGRTRRAKERKARMAGRQSSEGGEGKESGEREGEGGAEEGRGRRREGGGAIRRAEARRNGQFGGRCGRRDDADGRISFPEPKQLGVQGHGYSGAVLHGGCVLHGGALARLLS